MQRVQASSDAALDLFGSGKHGYTDGSPGVIAATEVHSDQFLNPVQEELATCCERSGIALSTTDNNQLFKSVFLRSARSSLVNASLRTSSMGGIMYGLAGRIPNALGQAPLMVLVGQTGGIGTSVDGTTWTARTAAGGYTGIFKAVYVDQDGAVIGGGSGELQTSPTGATWTHRTAAASYSGNFNAITRSGTTGLYLAVGSAGEIQTSPDGVNWTHRTAAASFAGTFYGAVWSQEYARFIITGTDGEVQTSPDGVTWTHRSSGAGTGVILYSVTCPRVANVTAAITTGPVVAVGAVSGTPTEDMLYFSLDGGVTWTRGTRPGSLGLTDSQFLGVSCNYVPGEDGVAMTYYVAVGLTGRVIVSANGRNWMDASRNLLGALSFNAVCCEPGSGTVLFSGTATALFQSQVI